MKEELLRCGDNAVQGVQWQQ